MWLAVHALVPFLLFAMGADFKHLVLAATRVKDIGVQVEHLIIVAYLTLQLVVAWLFFKVYASDPGKHLAGMLLSRKARACMRAPTQHSAPARMRACTVPAGPIMLLGRHAAIYPTLSMLKPPAATAWTEAYERKAPTADPWVACLLGPPIPTPAALPNRLSTPWLL